MVITGELIRTMRREAGMSQQELAKLSGVSQAHIAKIENGKVDPRLSTVNKILFFLGKKKKTITCGNIMNDHIVSARPDTPVPKVIGLMKSTGISQVPVMKGKTQIGSVREATLINNAHRNLKALRVSNIMDRPFPSVNAEDPMEMLTPLLDFHPAVLVIDKGNAVGIITKSDLLEVR